MRRFKEVRKEFERGSECLETAQGRNAQAPRGKQHEVEEATNALLNARRTFRSEALDYVLEVRENENKREEVISMFSFHLPHTKIASVFAPLLTKPADSVHPLSHLHQELGSMFSS